MKGKGEKMKHAFQTCTNILNLSKFKKYMI